MANYTAELKSYVEAGAKIFNFEYEFYDETKREQFEQNFIRHFYFREIGCETFDRFRWYLEDKMKTVFPYYNELFKAAQIEYNILDNYNVREEYEIRREGVDKSKGVSSTVGRVMDEQSSEVNDKRTGNSTLTTEGNGSRNDTETINNDTTQNSTDDTETTFAEETNRETDKATNFDEMKRNKNVKKYLDTPQGLLDLTDANYLTNLTQDNGDNETLSDTTENGTEKENKNGTETRNNTGSVIGTNDTERTMSSATTQNDSATGSDNSEGKTTSSYQAEQKATHDNNTRTERLTDHIEKSVYTKKGNIGIDTDSDMITKHINLQKVLRRIEAMFFDECEDLFMLVY